MAAAMINTPWAPTINIPVDLKEHQSVTINCSALTPCPHSPPELTWTLRQDSHRQTEETTEGTVTTKIQETITLSDKHDGLIINCSARYPVTGGNKAAEKIVTLNVSYAPRGTSASISPSGSVSAGSWVDLSCSSRAKPPASFSWFRNGKAGAVNVSVGPVYSFNVTEGGEFHCVATNDLGQNNSSVIQITIQGAVNFQILIPLLALIVVSLLICLVFSIWCFRSKHSTSEHTEDQREEDVYVEMAVCKPEEELHYGEVNFVRKRPEASSVSPQDGEQQDTVYAQVKVSNAGNSSARATDRPEDLYAEVKKK
ncbi:sialic acid-binding Ig-like lectin 14 [Fundulus diaphanus]